MSKGEDAIAPNNPKEEEAVMQDKHIDYKSVGGRHRHGLCNHCSGCHTPLLSTYCPNCEPSDFLYWCHKLWWFCEVTKTKIKLFFTGSEPLL